MLAEIFMVQLEATARMSRETNLEAIIGSCPLIREFKTSSVTQDRHD
jgi:hypothetical protein